MIYRYFRNPLSKPSVVGSDDRSPEIKEYEFSSSSNNNNDDTIDDLILHFYDISICKSHILYMFKKS